MADFDGLVIPELTSTNFGILQIPGLLVESAIATQGSGSTVTVYYRARFDGNYVYSTNTPPLNGTDVVIIARVTS